MSDTDAVAAALTGLRIRERELELDACAIRARVEEIRDLIGLLEHGTRRRPGRPRSAQALNTVPSQGELKQAMNIVPDRVAGGVHETEPGEAA